MQTARELAVELERQRSEHEASHLQAACQGDLARKSGRNFGMGGGHVKPGPSGLEGAAEVPGGRMSMLPTS